MSKSFFEFSQTNIETSDKQEEVKKFQAELGQETTKNIENTINTYSQMNQEELMSALFSEVNRQKQGGTLDLQRLESAIDSLGGFITPEQQTSMKETLKRML